MHYFLFRNWLDYEDFEDSLYVSDHVINEGEWYFFRENKDKILGDFKRKQLTLQSQRLGMTWVPDDWEIAFDSKPENYCEEYKAYCKFRTENDAKELFIKAHNLKKVDFEVFSE